MIKIEKLIKSYGKQLVLDAINLEFIPGQVYGIMGKNGAGKTTLFKCITGLKKYKGTIKYDKGILKNTLGYLQTEPYFFSKITGKEYLQLLCNARDIKYKSFDDHNIFDLPLNQYADTYSSGMKKKLALTGVLLQKNQVFVLDEPFNGVDIESNILIKEIIAKLKELNKIIIISSHIFSTLNETCDHLFLLENGVISERVSKQDFYKIEQKLTDSDIGDKVERLNLI